jgi:nucleoside-triphosphatase THEP1
MAEEYQPLITQVSTPQADLSAYVPDQPNPLDSMRANATYAQADREFQDVMASARKNLSQVSTDESLRPIAYDAEATNRDRYTNSEYFGELGFNPFRNNEELYGNAQTNFDKLKNAFTGMGALAWNQAVDQFKSWGDTFDVFSSQEMKAAFEKNEMEELARRQKALLNDNPIFETEADRQGIFNFNTIANTLQQSGFMVGAAVEIAAEEAALSYLTAQTFGGAAELQAARSVKLASNIAKAAKRTTELSESIHSANAMRKAFSVLQKTTALVNPIDNVMDFASGFKALRRADEMAYGATSLAKARTAARGFGALYRDFREFNLALSEAKVEASGTYSDLESSMTYNFETRYGRKPTDQEQQEIKNQALEAAQVNGTANTAMILMSNKLGFSNVLKGFKPLRYMMDEDIMKGLAVVSDKDALKIGKKVIEAADNRWMYYKNAIVSNPLKYFGANLSEALQENAQSISGDAVKAWYMAKYNGQELDSKFDAIRDAASKQFSVEGAKTFISGFFTGTIMGAAGVAFDRAGSLQQRLSDRAAYDERIGKEASARTSVKNAINEIYANPLSYNYNKESAANQSNFAALLRESAVNKDKKAFNDIQDDATRQFILTGINTGMLDLLTDRLVDYTKNLNEDEFTQAFGVEYTKENHADMVKQTQIFTQRAEEIRDIHNKLSSDYANPFNPGNFKYGTEEYIKEGMSYMSYKEAINQLTFMQDTYNRAITRQQQVLDSIKRKPGFENVGFTDIYSLTSTDKLASEIKLLQQEAEATQDPELKKQKEAKIDSLNKYNKELEKYLKKLDAANSVDNKNPEKKAAALNKALEEFTEKALPTFTSYINDQLAKAGKLPVQDNNARAAFENLTDYFSLQNDHEALLENINHIIDPINFSNYLNSHNQEMVSLLSKVMEAKVKEEEAELKATGKKVEVDPEMEGLEGEGDGIIDNDAESFYARTGTEGQKPSYRKYGLLKTAGSHFLDDDKTINTENNNHIFFKFTEGVQILGNDFYLLPITADNDELGIRREDKFSDDIKLVVVKKLADGNYVYVDVAGNPLENPTKDTIVYTSLMGNKTLTADMSVKKNAEAAVKYIREIYTVEEEYTDEDIVKEVEMLQQFREMIKSETKKGKAQVLDITGVSQGVKKFAEKDSNNRPLEQDLQGIVIDMDTTDFRDLHHPSGEAMFLKVVTIEDDPEAENVRPGSIVLIGKNTNRIHRVYNRQLSEAEIANITDVLAYFTGLIGNKKRSAQEDTEFLAIKKYLSGILHWASPVEGVAVPSTMMYISKGKLYRGADSIKFDAKTIKKELPGMLTGKYHSVNSSLVRKTDKFTEVTMVNGVPQIKDYSNYNEYLLSNADGRVPVLFTNERPYDSNPSEAAGVQRAGRFLAFAPTEQDLTDSKATVEKNKSPQKIKEDKAQEAAKSVKDNGDAKGTTTTKKRLTIKNTAAESIDSTASSTPVADTPATPVVSSDIEALLAAGDILNASNEAGIDATGEEMVFRLQLGPVRQTEDFFKLAVFMKRALPQVPIHKMADLIENKAWGAFKNGAIYIYENAEIGTGFHEAFESVWNSYLTKAQQDELAQEFIKQDGTFYNPFTNETKPYAEASMYDVREMLAEAFRDYMLTGKLPVNMPKQQKTFFQELINFIRGIFGLKELEFNDLESKINKVFVSINEGEFANAVPVRDLNNLETVYRAIPGTSQEFTKYFLDGITSFFFRNLYLNKKNIDALLDDTADTNELLVSLFKQSLADAEAYTRGNKNEFLAEAVSRIEQKLNRKLTDLEKSGVFNKLLNDNRSVLNKYKGLYNQLDAAFANTEEIYDLFKTRVSKYGLIFKQSDNDYSSVEEGADELKKTDNLGIKDSISIDPRKFGATNFKLLLAGLTDDYFNVKKGEIYFKRNPLQLPKSLSYDRVYAILLNELNGSIQQYKDGKVVNAIDEMFTRLDAKFKIKPVSPKSKIKTYKEGYEWIQRLKVRLKYEDAFGKPYPTENLSADDIELLVGFEQSLLKIQNNPIRTVYGEDGVIISDDSILTSTTYGLRDQWAANASTTAKPLSLKTADELLGIDDSGNVVFDTMSTPYKQFMARLTAGATIEEKGEEAVERLAMLGIKFTNTYFNTEQYRVIVNAFSGIKAGISKGDIFSIQTLFSRTGANASINALLNLQIATTSEENVLSHVTADGEQQYTISNPSTAGYVINAINSAATLKDLVLGNPQFGTVNEKTGEVTLHPYQQRSLLLKPGGLVFDEKGNKRMVESETSIEQGVMKPFMLQYNLISGVMTAGIEGKTTADLTEPDRLMQEIYHLTQNVYYTVINSDKSSEFAISLPKAFYSIEDITSSAGLQGVKQIYLDQLLDEIDAAVEEHKQSANIQYYSQNEKNGIYDVKKLGHYRDILGKDLVKRVADIAAGTLDKNVFVNSNNVTRALNAHIEQGARDTIDELIKHDIVVYSKSSGTFASLSLDADFLKTYLGVSDPYQITKSQMTSLATFLFVNKEIAITEQHKILYGHPALYKDLPKRSNGINSTKEGITDNITVRTWMDKNMPRLDRKVRSSERVATMKNRTFDDITVSALRSKEYAEVIYAGMIANGMNAEKASQKLGVTFDKDNKFVGFIFDEKGGYTGEIAKYLEINEADGQAWIMPDMYRDLLFLSKKLTRKQKAQIEYEMAYEIVARSKKPTSSNAHKTYDKPVLEQAKKTLAKGNPGGILNVIKPQYFGYAIDNKLMHTVFLKNSAQPKFYRFVEGTAFEDIYIASQEAQDDIINLTSGQKVGATLNSKGGFTQIYDTDGNANVTRDKDGKLSFTDVPAQTLIMRYFGIQQEVPSTFKYAVVRGTQVSKLIMSNFRVKGVYTSKESEKLVKEYNQIMTEMVKIGKKSLLEELGLTEQANGNYKATDLSKIVSVLRNELKQRELPDNVVDAINTITNEEGFKELEYTLDSSTAREKIDNILNAIVDSRVISEKMPGKPLVQVANTLFETKGRSYVYLKDGVYTDIAASKVNELTDDEKKTVRMVSSDLAFYKKGTGKNAKTTSMEVYLPWFMEDLIPSGNMKLVNGILQTGDYEIDPTLLKAIGFRIPTQGMNSIDSIKVKGFLPKEMGDMIVLPSEITGKSGSDFDIDKLQVYLANHYKQGNKIVAYKWQGNAEKTKAYYEDLYDKGQLLSPSDLEKIEKFKAKEASTPEGRMILAMVSSMLGEDSIAVSWLEGLKNAEERREKIVQAAVKKALQNRYIEVMNDLVLLPENFAQLITPNTTATLKGLANKINTLKGKKDDENAGYANLRSIVASSRIRHRFVSGKKLVGIAALQITSHIMSQIAGTKLSGLYNPERIYYLVGKGIKDKTINIRLNHDSNKELSLSLTVTQNGSLISDLFNEALSGFVDAAKDPFTFDLNLTMDTAATWFYMQRLGIDVDDIAYFFNQPILDTYFKGVASNKSYFKKIKGYKAYNKMLALEAANPFLNYIQSTKEYEDVFKELEIKPIKGDIMNIYKDAEEAGNFMLIASLDKILGAIYRKAQTLQPTITTQELEDNIKTGAELQYTMYAVYGSGLDNEEAEVALEKDLADFGWSQIGIMSDYLEYSVQGNQLNDYIRAQGYDNKKSKNIRTNKIQQSRWNKVVKDGFIANPQDLLDNTFIGEMKAQKESIIKMFEPFFTLLDRRLDKVFDPLMRQLESDLFMTTDDIDSLVEKYQNFVFNYIIQNTVYKNANGKDVRINRFKKMFFGDNSWAKKLRAYRESDDSMIRNNMFIKNLVPIISPNEALPDNIKSLRSTEDINDIVDSAKELLQYAENTGNQDLSDFLKQIAIYSILQTGFQKNYNNFTPLLPVEIYSVLLKNILGRFNTNENVDFNPEVIWEQFHQNMAHDSNVVPTPRFYKFEQGTDNVLISVDSTDVNLDYIKRTVLAVKDKRDQAELIRNGRRDEIFSTILYKKSGQDVVVKGVIYSRYVPINPLGLKYRLTELSEDPFMQSVIQSNASNKMGNLRGVNSNVVNALLEEDEDIKAEKTGNRPVSLDISTTDNASELIATGVKTRIHSYGNPDAMRLNERGVATINGVKVYVTYKGFKTLEEAGGKQEVLRTEGVTEDQVKGRLVVWMRENPLNIRYHVYELAPFVEDTLLKPEEEGTDPFETTTTTVAPIEQNFKDGQDGRKMQPQFEGKSTMDLVLSGDRTRTTRAKTDIDRMMKDYGLTKIEDLVGKVIPMTDKSGRTAQTVITKVTPFTQEYQDETWEKEGWEKAVTDKLVGQYPYAIEFELVQPTKVTANVVAAKVENGIQIPAYTIDRSITNSDGSKRLAHTDGKSITINPVKTVDEFFDYFTGKVGGKSSVQKAEVLRQMEAISPVYSLDALKQIINTTKLANLFLVLHEQSHIDNDDASIYWANGRDLMSQDKIEIEARATIEALLKVIEYRGAVENPGQQTLDKYELFPGVFANEGQKKAIDNIDRFLKNKAANQFLLKGRGGTGKTTIINKAISESGISPKEVIGATVAHEARQVLQLSMTNYNTVSIASLLGLVQAYTKEGEEYFRERTAQEQAEFESKGLQDAVETAKLIVIDEASMIDDFIYEKLLSRMLPEAKVIFMGDNVQIPPINAEKTGDSPIWQLQDTEWFSELTERMRQGAESPILPVTDVYAENVEKMQKGLPGSVLSPLTDRTNKITDNEGVAFETNFKKAVEDFAKDYNDPAFTKGVVLVAARREVVDNFNNLIRRAIFNTSEAFVVGDVLRVDRNYTRNRKVEYENGLRGKVTAVKPVSVELLEEHGIQAYQVSMEIKTIDRDFKEVMKVVTFNTVDPKQNDEYRNILKQKYSIAERLPAGSIQRKNAYREAFIFEEAAVDVKFGYAITSHRVQGSTYDVTYVHETDIMSFPGSAEEQNRMMYTAVSRPRKKLVILSSGVPTVTAERTTTVSADTNRMNARLAAAREAREVLKNKDKGCKK